MGSCADKSSRFAWLQWGRDVSIPEIRLACRWHRRQRGFNGAGMFPSQKFGRVAVPEVPICSFNGAGMFPSQKCIDPRNRKSRHVASMGPGCFHPRNGKTPAVPAGQAIASMGPGCFHPRNDKIEKSMQKYCWLQWGRDVSIPEIRRAAGPHWRYPSFNGAGMFPSQKYGYLPPHVRMR